MFIFVTTVIDNSNYALILVVMIF